MFKTVEWKKDRVVMIDQRLLPDKEVYNTYTNYKEVAAAIKSMVVRGAPAIGVSAAMGVALGALAVKTTNMAAFKKELVKVTTLLASTRPTAVNLFWGIERMKSVVSANPDANVAELKVLLVDEAKRIHQEDIDICKQIGRHGGALLKDKFHVLTHCNAGALATAGYGTALGVIRGAIERGKNIKVYADETRPFLQGARLTAWELMKDKIDVTLITDNMAGYMMQKGLINAVVVGADRIAANGDTANKIGTYAVAILAKEHKIPFYVAAPLSTIDTSIKHGDGIPIEERGSEEVTHIRGKLIAPKGVKVRNPAFDVTPNKYVTAIITEKGVVTAPYKSNINALFQD